VQTSRRPQSDSIADFNNEFFNRIGQKQNIQGDKKPALWRADYLYPALSATG